MRCQGRLPLCGAVIPAYFETRFRLPTPPRAWPHRFAIISACATTGHRWSDKDTRDADLQLATALAARGGWYTRITGYSPVTGHAELSWAADLEFDEACDLGFRFKQDAIYLVQDDTLWVSHCDHQRMPVMVGSFRERVDTVAAELVARPALSHTRVLRIPA